MAPKNSAKKTHDSQPAITPRLNKNGKPILQRNTLRQAQKPSTAKITLPAMPGLLPDMDAYSRLENELEQKRKECFGYQEENARLRDRVDSLAATVKRQQCALASRGDTDVSAA